MSFHSSACLVSMHTRLLCSHIPPRAILGTLEVSIIVARGGACGGHKALGVRKVAAVSTDGRCKLVFTSVPGAGTSDSDVVVTAPCSQECARWYASRPLSFGESMLPYAAYTRGAGRGGRV